MSRPKTAELLRATEELQIAQAVAMAAFEAMSISDQVKNESLLSAMHWLQAMGDTARALLSTGEPTLSTEIPEEVLLARREVAIAFDTDRRREVEASLAEFRARRQSLEARP